MLDFNSSSSSVKRLLLPATLASIVILYVVLACLFALYTPAWQAPDEPAHYNYISYLVAHGRFPELRVGDYPAVYLEQIKRRGFPPDMSIAPIRYEFHQPPLYYALVAPIYRLTDGKLIPLRLFSVLLGVGIVLLAYAIVRRLSPQRPGLALGTAAFVAFLPQHLVTVSQVGNDVLAELLYAGLLWMLLGLGQGAGAAVNENAAVINRRWSAVKILSTARRKHGSIDRGFALGVLSGLILITKTTAYIAVPLVGLALLWHWWRERVEFRRIAVDMTAIILPAALIALPWYLRNLATYGWPDFLGLIRHDQIVVGQLRTAEYLAQYGWGSYLLRLVEFTFKSFWGVFGWLGVFLDSRVYLVLALFAGIAWAGLLWRVMDRAVWPRAWLLAVSTLLTLLSYAWYNTQFVQHQGRYLFTALIPLAFGFVVGWEIATRPGHARYVAIGLVLMGLGIVAWSAVSRSELPRWPVAICFAAAVGLFLADLVLNYLIRSARGGRAWAGKGFALLRTGVQAFPCVFLFIVALYALFGEIVRQLS